MYKFGQNFYTSIGKYWTFIFFWEGVDLRLGINKGGQVGRVGQVGQVGRVGQVRRVGRVRQVRQMGRVGQVRRVGQVGRGENFEL